MVCDFLVVSISLNSTAEFLSSPVNLKFGASAFEYVALILFLPGFPRDATRSLWPLILWLFLSQIHGRCWYLTPYHQLPDGMGSLV